MTDTLFKKIVFLFCIHFGLPGPPLDAPAAPKTRPKRLKSAPRRSWRRFQSSHFGLPSLPSPFRWRQEPFGLHFRSNVDRFWKCLGNVFWKTFCIVVSCKWKMRMFRITAFLQYNLNILLQRRSPKTIESCFRRPPRGHQAVRLYDKPVCSSDRPRCTVPLAFSSLCRTVP